MKRMFMTWAQQKCSTYNTMRFNRSETDEERVEDNASYTVLYWNDAITNFNKSQKLIFVQ